MKPSMKTQPKPFTGSDLKSCQEPGAQEQVGGNPPAGCDAVRVRRPESLQVGKMADSSGRVGKSGGSGAGKGAVSAEQVIAGFNRLRQEQRGLASKAAELEMELNEHSLVIDTLKEVDETRKCYRMVGGVLVERTVKEVLPALEGNKEQVSKNSSIGVWAAKRLNVGD